MTSKLNQYLELEKNPFSKFSAEEELEFHKEIFYKPKFYNTLLDDLKSGTSRFILGQRGHGKSSIIHKLKSDLENSKVLTVIIDRFDGVSTSNNKVELLNLILNEFVTKFVVFIDKNRWALKKLDDEDKENLALLVKLFFNPLTKFEFENRYDNVKKVKTKKKLIRLFNRLLKPTNALINTGVLITSKLVSESFGLTNLNNKNYIDFVTEIEDININASDKENLLKKDKRHLKELLSRLNNIAKKTFFNSSVVLFDKVDEFQELNQDISKIASFAKDILTDTELLLQNDIAFAFSLWSEVKPILAKTVRFDKFKEIDISWKNSDMEPLIDKRILYFSGNVRSFSSLFSNQDDMDEVINISNKSPRDLISCMSDVYDFQTAREDSKIIDSRAVSNGLIKFAKRYDYLSMYPSRTGKNKDVINMINKILRTRKINITILDLNKTFNQKTRWSQDKLESMIKYKLIKEDDRLGDNKEKIYNVIDPKIKHLIKRNITDLEIN